MRELTGEEEDLDSGQDGEREPFGVRQIRFKDQLYPSFQRIVGGGRSLLI
jgi:hypothetical protein